MVQIEYDRDISEVFLFMAFLYKYEVVATKDFEYKEFVFRM